MAVLRRVPWYSSLEWLEVYNAIFSAGDEPKRAAITRISLWELKSPRVPVSVSCMKLLLEAFLADPHRHPGELQMLYGMAIVRFVNSHVDLQQQKHYAESIAVAAGELGIPCEIVNCRHRLAHNDMPSLELLRHTAKLCWDYLEARYWRPQAELIQSRVQSMGNSKHLASGLIALLQDLEAIAPPDDLEASLQALSQEIIPSKRVSVRALLMAAASVAGLRQKETMRALKRLRIPEVLGHPTFVAATTWCSTVRDLLPRCLNFIETVLHTCPQEDLALSFLKDLVLVSLDPHTNCAGVLCVFWIIVRESPNFTIKLVHRIMRSLAPIRSSDLDTSSSGSAAATSCSGAMDDAFAATADGVDATGEEATCFNRESFSLWLRAMDIDPVHEEQLKRDLETLGKYRERLLGWLRCLLLLPPDHATDHNSTTATFVPSSSSSDLFLPNVIDLSLHLFCGSRLDAALATHASFSSRDAVARQLLSTLNLVQTRVLAACKALLKPVALAAFECLVAKTVPLTPDASDALQRLLRVFNEADAKVPHSTATRLVEWFNQRLMVPHRGGTVLNPLLSRRVVLERFFPEGVPRKQDPASSAAMSGSGGPSLGDQLHALLWGLRQRALDATAEPDLRQRASVMRQRPSFPAEDVQELDPSTTPWTNPGTTAAATSLETSSCGPLTRDVLISMARAAPSFSVNPSSPGAEDSAHRKRAAAGPPDQVGGGSKRLRPTQDSPVSWRATPAALRQLETELMQSQFAQQPSTDPQKLLEHLAVIEANLHGRLEQQQQH